MKRRPEGRESLPWVRPNLSVLPIFEKNDSEPNIDRHFVERRGLLLQYLLFSARVTDISSQLFAKLLKSSPLAFWSDSRLSFGVEAFPAASSVFVSSSDSAKVRTGREVDSWPEYMYCTYHEIPPLRTEVR